ncbi:MAG: diaminopimelate epimerase [Bacteroidales bacterium]
MEIQFSKYHGNGNDFVIIDNRKKNLCLTQKQIEKICNRRFGIGADGLILIEPSKENDFYMTYYNSNGLIGSMCGNGGRCASAFVATLIEEKKDFSFEASDGLHLSSIVSSNDHTSIVRLKMIDCSFPTANGKGYFIDTGSPHHIQYVKDLNHYKVFEEGRKIRYSELYPNGSNINFVEKQNNKIHCRTYERGVEKETLSCGTGVTAVALTQAFLEKKEIPIQIHAIGGDFIISYTKTENGFKDVYLEGPASFVFCGKITL